MIHAILAYVITYFGQAKNYLGQVKVIKLLTRHGKLVLELMLVPSHVSTVFKGNIVSPNNYMCT